MKTTRTEGRHYTCTGISGASTGHIPAVSKEIIPCADPVAIFDHVFVRGGILNSDGTNILTTAATSNGHGDTCPQSMSPCCKKQAQVSHQITRKVKLNKTNIQITDCIHITILLQIWFPDKLIYSLCLVLDQLPL